MKMVKIKKSSNGKIITAVVAAIVVILLALTVLEKLGVTNFYPPKPRLVATPEAKTTSTAPTAQANFNGGDNRQPSSTNSNEGIVTDTGGNIPKQPPQNESLTSSDRAITVYSPLKNSIVKNGGQISGSSSQPRVAFRLIDDVSGVIVQGTLAVVNGKFSGTFNFSTTGTNGRFDVFYVKDNGIETSSVEVPIRFR